MRTNIKVVESLLVQINEIELSEADCLLLLPDQLDYRREGENASLLLSPTSNIKEYQFPLYVGPILTDTKIQVEDAGDITIMSLVSDYEEFCFDIIFKSNIKDYESRIADVRNFVNANRPQVLDLPMERVEDLGEFIKLQKEYFKAGYRGVIYYNANDMPDEKNITKPFSIIKFKGKTK